MEKKRSNNVLFTVEVRIGFRGTLYEFRLAQLVKWLGAIALIGFRLYRQLHGPGP